MRKTGIWAATSMFTLCSLLLFLGGTANALDGLEDLDSAPLQSRISNPLFDLAQNGGDRKACHQEGSLEQCAGCCRAARDTCVSLVIPMCHQDDPNRSEFRHCTKDRERRCQTDFDNCAWLCRKTK